jgi:uncharacterized protein involved in exopolysaccharide biosynthesis
MSEPNLGNTRKGEVVEPTLRDVLAPLFRHRRLLIVSFLGIFLGGLLSAIVKPKQYDANMKILVKRERVDPVVTTDATTQGSQPAPAVTEEELNSEVQLLKSRDLLEKVVRANGLQQEKKEPPWALLPRQQNAEMLVSGAVDQLARALSVEVLTKTDLIQVSYKSTDPQLACRVLNTLADFYMEKHLAVHRPPGAFDFFQQETEQYQKGLENAEMRLARFGQEQKVASPEVERDLALRKLNDFEATLHETETGIAETQNRITDLEAQLKVTPSRLSTTQKAADNSSTLMALEGSLSALELKHTEMVAHFKPDYRPLKDLETQIAQARAQIAEVKSVPIRESTTDLNPSYLWLTQELVKSRADLVTLQARAAATSRNVQIYRQSTLDLGQKQIEEKDLMRNAKAEEGNFLLYLNKREEARISDALDNKRIVNVAVAESATVPARPTGSPWLIVALGTLLACTVSTGAAFVSDYIDPSLRTPDELRDVLQIPVLAALPKEKARRYVS